MAGISKHIPKDVKPRKELGFGRPATDLIDCPYEARVYESTKKGIGSLVFFDITTKDGSFAWGINASDLLGLEKHPVGTDRIVQDQGWVVTIPSDRNSEPTFIKAV